MEKPIGKVGAYVNLCILAPEHVHALVFGLLLPERLYFLHAGQVILYRGVYIAQHLLVDAEQRCDFLGVKRAYEHDQRHRQQRERRQRYIYAE